MTAQIGAGQGLFPGRVSRPSQAWSPKQTPCLSTGHGCSSRHLLPPEAAYPKEDEGELMGRPGFEGFWVWLTLSLTVLDAEHGSCPECLAGANQEGALAGLVSPRWAGSQHQAGPAQNIGEQDTGQPDWQSHCIQPTHPGLPCLSVLLACTPIGVTDEAPGSSFRSGQLWPWWPFEEWTIKWKSSHVPRLPCTCQQ